MNKKADTKEFIFQRLKDEREKLAFFGVKNIGLFGSFVMGSQTALSDIDILVEFMPEKHTFDNFMEVAFLWRKVTGMRDRLIHDYFGVDYAIVWDVATTKLPDLRAKLQALLDATETRHFN